jgi:hypothetical protein
MGRVYSRIGALYGIEEEVRGKPAGFCREIRQARAKPLLDDLRNWLEKSLRSLSAKSETAGAIRYALAHWCLSSTQACFKFLKRRKPQVFAAVAASLWRFQSKLPCNQLFSEEQRLPMRRTLQAHTF